MVMTKWRACLLASLLLLAPTAASAQQETAPESEEQRLIAAAEEVEKQVVAISGLQPTGPIPKRLKSREEIRQYVMEQMHEEYPPAKLRGDQLALEKFGLLPKNFPLERTLVDILTGQVAAYYDPKRKEFYVADWIPAPLQRPIMAHELTHALQDQRYNLQRWLEAVKTDDDASIARDAVLEGSATAVMFEYLFAPMGRSVKDMTDLEDLLRAGLLSDAESQQQLGQAPRYIQQVLLFPYLEGASFFQRMLNVHGWKATEDLFQRPPRSSREILHPDVYLAQNPPARPVELPALGDALPQKWHRLDENVVGEFGVRLILQQEFDREESAEIADGWRGDRYEVYEGRDGEALLVFRSRWRDTDAAQKFLDAYIRTRKSRYAHLRSVRTSSDSFRAETDEGGVFVRRRGDECLIVEGAQPAVLESIERRVWATQASAATSGTQTRF